MDYDMTTVSLTLNAWRLAFLSCGLRSPWRHTQEYSLTIALEPVYTQGLNHGSRAYHIAIYCTDAIGSLFLAKLAKCEGLKPHCSCIAGKMLFPLAMLLKIIGTVVITIAYMYKYPSCTLNFAL